MRRNDQAAEPQRRIWQIDPNHLTGRDLLLLVPIIVGLFVLFIVLDIGEPNRTKWSGLALDTGVLFAFLIHKSQSFLKSRPFWLLTASFLGVHLALWIAILTHVSHWGLLGFNFMALEILPFFYFRDWPR